MSSVLENAKRNIVNNCKDLECVEDAQEMALTYVTEYASAIASNINQAEDKQELAMCLEHQILGNAFVLQVCCKYLEEVERNMELEVEEMIESITSEAVKEEQ